MAQDNIARVLALQAKKEAGAVPEVFEIEFTQETSGEALIPSKTFAELVSAITTGKTIDARFHSFGGRSTEYTKEYLFADNKVEFYIGSTTNSFSRAILFSSDGATIVYGRQFLPITSAASNNRTVRFNGYTSKWEIGPEIPGVFVSSVNGSSVESVNLNFLSALSAGAMGASLLQLIGGAITNAIASPGTTVTIGSPVPTDASAGIIADAKDKMNIASDYGRTAEEFVIDETNGKINTVLGSLICLDGANWSGVSSLSGIYESSGTKYLIEGSVTASANHDVGDPGNDIFVVSVTARTITMVS